MDRAIRPRGHRGIKGNRVLIANSVVRETAQGIEAGYGTPFVRVEQTLLTANGIGRRSGYDHTWDVGGKRVVRSSIVLGNRDDDVQNYVTALEAPVPVRFLRGACASKWTAAPKTQYAQAFCQTFERAHDSSDTKDLTLPLQSLALDRSACSLRSRGC